MPTELLDYIRSLPSASQNNSREIVRTTWECLNRKYDQSVRGQAAQIANIMNVKFGLGLEADYSESDYGGQRKK